MDFSVVTPSFRSSRWLKLCIASVADQKGVSFEHLIQDAGSDDGTLDWLPQDKRVSAFVEKDNGMYDAVNRGYRRARGDLLSYINCDEQYLPDALTKVRRFFSGHPQIDVVFGNCIVVGGRGDYICERGALTPQWFHTWTSNSLSFLTAATFIRRRTLEEQQLFFDKTWRDLGDVEWSLRLIKSGVKMAVIPEFLSIFTETGSNMNLGENARRERIRLHTQAPALAKMLKGPALIHYRLRRWRAGYYSCSPHKYEIYTSGSQDQRRVFHVTNPTFRWNRPVPL